MTFHTPSIWFLVLLVAIPFLWWRWRRPIMRTGIMFSSTADAGMLPSTIRRFGTEEQKEIGRAHV